MPISATTRIGGNQTSSTVSSLAITVPAGGVPENALVVVRASWRTTETSDRVRESLAKRDRKPR